jgi:hypothetical protein
MKMKRYKKLLFLFCLVLVFLAKLSMGIRLASSVPTALQNTQGQTDSARLAAVLKKAETYCRRLDRAALDFVCLEEVTEMTRHFTPKTDVYLYDYQFIRKDNAVKEQRNLISVNGEKTDIRDSSLDTSMFKYKNVLFGPVGLLSRTWQTYHDYKLIGEDVIYEEKVVVIETTPGANLVQPHCYGKLWIKEGDGSVLKIVWDQRSLGNFQSIEEWAKIHDAKPEITAYCEYGIEKNGIRFPSRSYTENAYIDKNNRKFVSAEISILYKDYKFFTVETEIKYEE